MTQYLARWKSGVSVVWRGLTWAEYRQYTQRLTFESPMEVYIDLYRALLVEGPDITEAPAGVVDFIARSMLETNPFSGEYQYVKHALDARRNVQDWLAHAKALVAGVFRYTFEEIDSWDADTFFDRVAKAEFLAGKRLDPEDPQVIAAAAETAKAPGHPKPGPRQKKPLTQAQQLVLDRVREAKS